MKKIIFMWACGCLLIFTLFQTLAFLSEGGFARKELMNNLLIASLPNCVLNDLENKMFDCDTKDKNYPYISSYHTPIDFALLGKWHIEGVGVVPFWSKWNKVLSERRDYLLVKQE